MLLSGNIQVFIVNGNLIHGAHENLIHDNVTWSNWYRVNKLA